MNTKEIRYDRETHDYAMYLDGELVGLARNYHEAEITLDQLLKEARSWLAAVCPYCGGSHHIQKCPEVLAALFAATDDAPGEDCPDHGPYSSDDCPKCEALEVAAYCNTHGSHTGSVCPRCRLPKATPTAIQSLLCAVA